jgi:hypothetical protein
MARIRTIKPDFFRHEALFEAEITSGLPLRVAFAGLWTVADREGRFRWKPRQLKLDVLPFDALDFSLVLDLLIKHGFIVKYTSGSEEFGVIPSWHRHQFVNNKESDSTLPVPIGVECATRQPRVTDKTSTREPHVTDALRTREPHVADATSTPLVLAQGEGEGEGKGKLNLLPAATSAVPANMMSSTANALALADTASQSSILKSVPKAAIDPAGFTEFWAAWPSTARKVDRKKCAELWKRKNFSMVLQIILAHVAVLRDSKLWRDGYEPAPMTYLTGERWNDSSGLSIESMPEAGYV